MNGLWAKQFRKICGDDFVPETQARLPPSYPYVVWYAMPTVYPTLHMRLKRGRPLYRRIVDDLLERVKAASRITGKRMCVVIAPENCIYVDPDGTTRQSSAIPRGPRIGGLDIELAVDV